jgi:hypothetical protein
MISPGNAQRKCSLTLLKPGPRPDYYKVGSHRISDFSDEDGDGARRAHQAGLDCHGRYSCIVPIGGVRVTTKAALSAMLFRAPPGLSSSSICARDT